MKSIIILLLFLGFSSRLTAQHIEGSVHDENRRPLEGVTIRLYRAGDSSQLKQQATDAQGQFSFEVEAHSGYRLAFSAIGYQNLEKRLESTAAVTLVLQMKASAKNLKEVNIVSTAPVLTVSKGKLTYNLEQSPTASGSTALELLRKMPGLKVDQEGNILLKGSPAVNVMVDGRMTYLSGTQLSRLLDGMNAASISKIEVINTPSSEFDAAGNAGVINVITRKTAKPGYSLNLTGGLTVSRYLLNNESVAGNIRTGRFNVYGNFGYGYRRRFTEETSTLTETDAGGNPVVLHPNGINPNQTHLYNFKTGADFFLSPKQQLGFSYTGTVDDWRKDAHGTILVTNGAGQVSSQVLSHNYAKEPYYKNIYNFNYQFKLDTTGKLLSADADHIRYRNLSDGFLTSSTLNSAPVAQLNFHQPNLIQIFSVKTDLVLPFRHWKYKGGLKYARVSTDNQLTYDSLVNGQSVYAASLSNHFQYRESIAAAYSSASFRWGANDIEGGLRAEHTETDANAILSGQRYTRSYLSWFPSLSLSRKFDADHQFDISFSRRINRPAYTSLNPVRFFNDAYSTYQGNPALVAETSWTGELSYTWKNRYIASLSEHLDEHFIAPTAILDPNTHVLTLSTGNFPHRNRVDAQLIIPVTITPWWELETTAGLSYTAYPVAQLSGPQTVQKVSADLYAGQTFHLPAAFLLELQTRYTTPELNGIYMVRYYFTVDGGIKKMISKQLEARFAFADLLHTGWYWGYSLSNTLLYDYKNTPDSRRFTLSLSYRIGGKLNTGGIHRTEEQNRL